MDRRIEVRVNGSYLDKDSNYAGVQHEANSTWLHIVFNDIWDSLSKKVTWWNAKGENPVEIILSTNYLDKPLESLLSYLVPIPGEAMEEDGQNTFVIDGYSEGLRVRSVEASLIVRPARYADTAGSPSDVTPTQAEQLQAEIDSMKEGIQKVASAKEYADAAEQSAASAAASATAAEESKNGIGSAVSDAQAAAADAQNAAVRAENAATGVADSAAAAAQSAAEAAAVKSSVEGAVSEAQSAVAAAESSAVRAESAAESASKSADSAKIAEDAAKGYSSSAQSASDSAGSSASTASAAQAASEKARDDAQEAAGRAETAAADVSKSAAAAAQSAADAANIKLEVNSAVSDAQSAATAAENSAGRAEAAAESAEGSAGNARISADEAQGYASSAQASSTSAGSSASAASAAQAAAEKARDEAQSIAGGDFASIAYVDQKSAAAETNANAYTDEQIAQIPAPDVSGQIETHNQSESSHQDIRTKVEAAAAAANTAGTDLASHVISSDAHSGVLEPAFTDAKDKTVSFSEASEKANISTGDKFSVIAGKLAKWFSSFGSAAWKSVGTGADDVAAGNHTHGNVSNDGKLGSDAGKLAATGADGVLQAKSPDEVSVAFSAANEKSNIASGDTLGTILGKLAKWFSSFGSAAWKGVGTGADDVAAGNHTHADYLTAETDPNVPAWAKASTKPTYTATEVGADPSGTASGAVSSHNSAEDAHSGVLEKAFTDAKNKTVSFSTAASRENIATGETLGTIMGKLAKWFSSFGSAAWKGVGTGADDVAAGDHTHDGYIPTSEKGAASGVATLDSRGVIIPAQACSTSYDELSSFTLSEVHYGRFVLINSAEAAVVTIPTGVPKYTEIEIYRVGAGTVTLSAADGVTVRCKESNYGIADQYTSVVLKWISTNMVAIEGNVG